MNTGKPLRRALGIYTRRSGTGMLIETYHDGYVLNDSATFLWSLVGTGRSADDIADAMAAHYQLDPGEARSLTEDFLDELASHGFLD